MNLRTYKPSDCSALAELFYDTVHTVNRKDYTEEQVNVWATGKVDLQSWNDSFLAHYTLVAVEDETVIGFGDMDDTGYLDRLYVHKDYQGRGVATAICDALEAKIPGRYTTHASITARPFFEKRGYRVVKAQQVLRQGIALTNFVMEKKTMIILITGASHTGKTLLAQRLLAKYSYPYLSIDHLKMGLIRSGNTALTPEDDRELEDYLWPIVREMVKTAIENGQNLVVEGGYIPADWETDFAPEYLKEIRFICLVMTPKYIESHFAEIKSHASDIENRLNDSWCTKESLLAENAYYGKHYANCTWIDEAYEINL